MESDTDRKKKWKLKKINKCWFLDVGGKLTRMNMLNNATDVYMEDNVIFADDLVFQLTEESDDEVTVTEIKDICLKHKTSEYEEKESVARSEKEDSIARNSADKKELGESLESKSDRNVDTTQDAHLTDKNRSSRAELTLIEGPEYLYGDVDGQETDHELGSEEYVRKKGKFRGFFKRVKHIVKKKASSKHKEELLYEDISNTIKEFTPIDSDGGGSEEDGYDYTLFEPMKVHNASSDAVPGARIVTALFDFNKFSEDEISFQKQDKLKLRGETLSVFTENCDWSLAEHLPTSKKGYIPLAYVTESIHALKAQSWWFDISRREASGLLRMPGSTPGTYLVRPSKSERGFILSLLCSGSKVLHYQIRSENGRLYIEPRRSFNDIFELIYFYKCTSGVLRRKLKRPAQKQNPFVYPRKLEVEVASIGITKSFRCGDYGEFFIGKFSSTLDVTIVTKFKLKVEKFLAETNVLHNFRQCKHFVRVFGVIISPAPFMIILGETVRNTLQQYLRIDGGKTITLTTLLEIAAEVAEGMAFLEKENVVHRHLKADNVFVCDFDQPKIVHPKLTAMMKDRFSDEHRKDLIEKDTLSRLHEGFRLSKPKDGPVPCPVAFYVTILKCWHRLPECRPTFYFLEDFFNDFENAVKCISGLEDPDMQDLYMCGPLQQGSPILDTPTEVRVRSLRKPEARFDPQKSEPQVSTPMTSESYHNIGITEPTQITGGFSVKALYDYKAEEDDEVSLYEDDIVTNVDPAYEGWWIGTTANGARGMFPSNYVEIFESPYAEVHKL
ncbi:tyrosine-protein kinase Blk-like isoform X2 [Mercenaria mercenaria]|uniref:tyrosine-protein kinase Blk-like isoform X2 n=1 Tax=Mercenaria mercenaria TaxID=6596 RepID=UPI00234F4EA2|nr:tyrosine-protein kinase Blk-like isoform X2 [Mercenaria mercenaria]